MKKIIGMESIEKVASEYAAFHKDIKKLVEDITPNTCGLRPSAQWHLKYFKDTAKELTNNPDYEHLVRFVAHWANKAYDCGYIAGKGYEEALKEQVELVLNPED